MNPFNQSIAQAKKRQRNILLLSLGGFLLVAMAVAAILLISQGTRLEIQPAEAQPVELQVERGLAVVLFNTVYSLSSSPQIRITAPRFKPHLQTLDTESVGKVVNITLTPQPASILFTADPDDEQTRWRLDEAVSVAGKSLKQELAPGDYQLTVEHPYYETQRLNFSLEPAQQLTQHITLSPITGYFRVDSIPSAATVWIDEQSHGKTPLELELSGGRYQVVVTQEGFADTRETLEIRTDSQQITRNYRLAAEQGHVTFHLHPEGGQLTVNGITEAHPQRITLEANKAHQIRYSKPGYFSQTEEVQVAANQTQTVHLTLEQEMGRVEVVSTPAAAVSVNGEAKGTTPIELSLNAVAQTIRVSLPGYRTRTQTVTPSADAAQRVAFTLVPETQAQLDEAPRQYTTQAGGEMRLFLPNDAVITLGARRDEAGQRANEFIRQVRLSRPFYAGVHEVTNAEYQRFDSNHSADARLPVTAVSWLDAARFCNWLSQTEGFQAVYRFQGEQLTGLNAEADGYRLLTEAEWEWLARKAGRSQQTRFAWGDDTVIPEQAANIADESARGSVREYVPRYNDGYAGIAPIKSFNRELSGLYDMAGNVSEWVHDSYTLTVPKPDVVTSDILDPAIIGMRVVKGANWQSGSLTELRASFREGLDQPRADLGFRIGRYLNKGAP